MIYRLVTMQFHPEFTSQFLSTYSKVQPVILTFSGCNEVRLLQSVDGENRFTTYSVWDSEEHLNHYRYSEFFKSTWSVIRPWMSEKPVAISYREVNHGNQ